MRAAQQSERISAACRESTTYFFLDKGLALLCSPDPVYRMGMKMRRKPRAMYDLRPTLKGDAHDRDEAIWNGATAVLRAKLTPWGVTEAVRRWLEARQRQVTKLLWRSTDEIPWVAAQPSRALYQSSTKLSPAGGVNIYVAGKWVSLPKARKMAQRARRGDLLFRQQWGARAEEAVRRWMLYRQLAECREKGGGLSPDDRALFAEIKALPSLEADLRSERQQIGEVRGFKVLLVDGSRVKVVNSIEFVEGGNGYAYSFIPKDEIWIDGHLALHDRPFDIFHEIREAELMREGADYEDAHAIANPKELSLRRENGVGMTVSESAEEPARWRRRVREYGEHFLAAADKYGLTSDHREAGYILPSGHMLDFSGRHEMPQDYTKDERGHWRVKAGRDYLYGQRSTDHRDVGDMDAFKDSGAVRFSMAAGDHVLFDAHRLPTNAQLSHLHQVLGGREQTLALDLKDGERKVGLIWGSAKPTNAVGVIRRFYKGENFRSGEVVGRPRTEESLEAGWPARTPADFSQFHKDVIARAKDKGAVRFRKDAHDWVLSRSTTKSRKGWWRITSFEGGKPWGHREYPDPETAMQHFKHDTAEIVEAEGAGVEAVGYRLGKHDGSRPSWNTATGRSEAGVSMLRAVHAGGDTGEKGAWFHHGDLYYYEGTLTGERGGDGEPLFAVGSLRPIRKRDFDSRVREWKKGKPLRITNVSHNLSGVVVATLSDGREVTGVSTDGLGPAGVAFEKAAGYKVTDMAGFSRVHKHVAGDWPVPVAVKNHLRRVSVRYVPEAEAGEIKRPSVKVMLAAVSDEHRKCHYRMAKEQGQEQADFSLWVTYRQQEQAKRPKAPSRWESLGEAAREAKDPRTMSAAGINKELDRLDAQRDDFADRMIAAGRGHETPHDYLDKSKTDPLSREAQILHARHMSLRIEVEQRYGPNAPRRLPAGKRFGPRVRESLGESWAAIVKAGLDEGATIDYSTEADCFQAFDAMHRTLNGGAPMPWTDHDPVESAELPFACEDRGELRKGDQSKLDAMDDNKAWPDKAEDGKAFVVLWAGGRAIAAFRTKAAVRSWAQKQGKWAELCWIHYEKPERKGKKIHVTETYDTAWPDPAQHAPIVSEYRTHKKERRHSLTWAGVPLGELFLSANDAHSAWRAFLPTLRAHLQGSPRTPSETIVRGFLSQFPAHGLVRGPNGTLAPAGQGGPLPWKVNEVQKYPFVDKHALTKHAVTRSLADREKALKTARMALGKEPTRRITKPTEAAAFLEKVAQFLGA